MLKLTKLTPKPNLIGLRLLSSHKITSKLENMVILIFEKKDCKLKVWGKSKVGVSSCNDNKKWPPTCLVENENSPLHFLDF